MAEEYERYLDGALPAPTVILGQELLPLSVGHLLNLDRFGALPALTPEKITLGIIICTRSHEELAATLQDNFIGLKIRAWLFRYSPIKSIDWAKKMLEFSDYIDRGTEAPSFISKEGESGGLDSSGTPWLQHLKTTLQARLNYTPSQAMDCPYSQAVWDYYTYHELEGNGFICNRELRKTMHARANAQHDSLIQDVINRKTGNN